ncbi:arginine--tRNA ligase [Xenorhabdus japonica]|uniref:Arginine--tRNA ligase n=1 Tax=Xenorhabdus japonica TaxID=53341 RepID=A0A1I4YD71_9GAMM|nr:arginine--tRNA ligase [Xenorhabdus japonica]SFN35995.1 arginyl-tRNA synthetase [Xenorhabdus japonica]
MNLLNFLASKAQDAIISSGLPKDINPATTKSTRSQFGDYQLNGAMAAGKKLNINPREIANKIVENLDLDEIAEKIEIAGPGFINIHLKPEYLAKRLVESYSDAKLGISQLKYPKNVVVDYSSPNLAKELHVGHIRSTVIGDAIARCLEFRGINVIRQNHVGDWGTQFGMLLAYFDDLLLSGNGDTKVALQDLENFYRDAKQRFDKDETFANKSRDYVVKLQNGDKHCSKLWHNFIQISIEHTQNVYKKLNTTLRPEHIKAESAYNDMLPGVITRLKELNIAVEEQGAQVVFIDELANKTGEPSIFIVQKSNGGYLYSTTDLAACDYRSHELKADRIMIFVDSRQKLHFEQVEITARKAGLLAKNVALDICTFGNILDENGKPFKTRSGETIKLSELLNEAVERAKIKLLARGNNWPEDEMDNIAEKIGIGAVKYAELSKNRINDYIFSWDDMLSFEGSTAPYLQYAYSRIQSILRKASSKNDLQSINFILQEEKERAIAIKLLQFEEVLDTLIQDATPHILCNYLYELSCLYMRFYEECPILKNDVAEEIKTSRLLLSNLTGKTLAKGLNLLGIEVMDRM